MMPFLDEALLAVGTAYRLRGQDLNGHRAIQAGVQRGVDDTHAALAEFF